MAKEKINLRNELRLYKFDFDLLQKIPCSKKDNKKYEKLLKDGGVLPEGVFAYGYETGDALSMLRTIQNCILVLTVSSIIYMVVSIFV